MQMMGGRFRNMMPSDLFKPGACARESLPARSANYASEVNRGELKHLMHRCARPILVDMGGRARAARAV